MDVEAVRTDRRAMGSLKSRNYMSRVPSWSWQKISSTAAEKEEARVAFPEAEPEMGILVPMGYGGRARGRRKLGRPARTGPRAEQGGSVSWG